MCDGSRDHNTGEGKGRGPVVPSPEVLRPRGGAQRGMPWRREGLERRMCGGEADGAVRAGTACQWVRARVLRGQLG